jgi:hypothetical protein
VFQAFPLLSKLLTQLAPAVVVTAVGILMLSNLAKPVDTAPAEPATSAIATEAVFTPAPPRAAEVQAEDREQSQAKPSTARAAAKPKAAAASIEPAPLPETAAPPLQIVPPQPAPDTSVMGRLRGMGTAVRQMPQRAYSTVASTVTGWFAEEAPPRPPEPVPTRNFL